MIVRDLMTKDVISVPPWMPMLDARALMTKERIRHLPVTSPEGELLGIITDEEFAALRAEPGLDSLVNAADLMRPPIAVQQRDDLRTALETMLALGLRRIPVVDEHMLFAGLLDEETIARAYLRGDVK